MQMTFENIVAKGEIAHDDAEIILSSGILISLAKISGGKNLHICEQGNYKKSIIVQ